MLTAVLHMRVAPHDLSQWVAFAQPKEKTVISNGLAAQVYGPQERRKDIRVVFIHRQVAGITVEKSLTRRLTTTRFSNN